MFRLLLILQLFSPTVWGQGEVYNFQRRGADVAVYSNHLQQIQEIIQKHVPSAKIYIGGGAARSLMDNQIRGLPLDIRDFDLQVTTNGPLNPTTAELIKKELMALSFHQPEVASPTIDPAKEIFLNDGQRDLDISYFASEDALNRRGIYTVDTFKISLQKPLKETLALVKKDGYPAALAKGLLRDPFAGYPHWTSSQVIPLPDAERVTFPTLSVRTARTMTAMGVKEIPADAKEWIARTKAESYSFQRKSWSKSFLRLLSGANPAAAVKLLVEMGGLQDWSPDLQEKLAKLSEADINRLFAGQTGEVDPALLRYKAIVELAPKADQFLLFRDIVKVAPKVSQEWMLAVRPDTSNKNPMSCAKSFTLVSQ
jgi:hypothetical protein